MKESEVIKLAKIVDAVLTKSNYGDVTDLEVKALLREQALPESLSGLVIGATVWQPTTTDWLANIEEAL